MLDFRKEDVIIQPKEHKYTLVFLPGFSRSARVDWNVFKTVPFLKETRIRIVQSPHTRFFANNPALFPSWYTLLPQMLVSLVPGLNEISKLIEEIIQEEYSKCPNVFLGGFSQGGVTALYTGLLISKVPLLGILCLSCFVAPVNYESARKNIPIFMYHGEKDEIVSVKSNKSDLNRLPKHLNITHITEIRLGHTYSWKEFVALQKWMQSCVNLPCL